MESACAEIIRLAEKVMDGGEITQEEAKKLIRTKDEDTMLLLAMADKIRQKFNGNAVAVSYTHLTLPTKLEV